MSAYADQLAAVPLFSACSRSDLMRLAGAADEVVVGPGTELTVEGAVGREMFVLLEGNVEVRKAGRVETELGPGDHFGELALLDGGPRTATVVTTTDATLVVITKPAFAAVLDEIPTLAHKLLVSLARRLRESEQSPGH
jgi:CRP/FNR family transcriptional regulator, cyclic AMP receptor protein